MGAIVDRLGGTLDVVQLADIEINDRTRQDYGDLQELALSLSTLGQLQNLVLTRVCDNDKPYKLLAGGRRYKVMTELLEWSEASALIFDKELSELELLEVEFDENARRKAFTWKEDCTLKARIHELRQQEKGVKQSTAADAPGASIRSTAEELGISHATLSIDVALAKASDNSPQIFEGCKTKKEAIRAMRTAGEVMLRSELAKRMLSSMSSQPTDNLQRVKSLADRYILQDCFAGMKTIPDGSINFIEIDPPYAIELHRQKKGNQLGLSAYNEVIYDDYVAFLQALFSEAYRVMNSNSWLICWFAPDPWFEVIHTLLTAAGFGTTRLTGKWVKPLGQSHNPTRFLANACEEFFYAWKGEPSLAQAGRINVFPFMPLSANKKIHPTQRPMELMLDLLKTFCWEGDRILVPFLGSGTTLLAAEKLGFSAFGYELEQTYKDSFLFMASELFA